MQQSLQFIILTFIYNSTCFGHPHVHHQELNNCSSSLWSYLYIVVIAVLLFMFGPVMGDRIPIPHDWPDHKHRHSYHHDTKVKPEATTTVELLMMGVRTPETC
jgi:hypothetical protein